jgi:hypothetical protein
MHCPNPFMKITWKFEGMIIWVILFEIICTIHNRKQFKLEGFKDIGLQVKCVVSAVTLIGYQGLIVWSAQYTFLSHTYIFALQASVIAIVYKIFLREPLHKLEKIGAALAILGCAIAFFEYTPVIKMPHEMRGSVRNMTTHGPNMTHIFDSSSDDSIYNFTGSDGVGIEEGGDD